MCGVDHKITANNLEFQKKALSFMPLARLCLENTCFCCVSIVGEFVVESSYE